MRTILQNSKWFGEQRVGTVSKKSGKGKHTTRHVSLLPIPGGGFLADTPGFNQPSLMKVTKKSLAETFPEVCFALFLVLICLIFSNLHCLHDDVKAISLFFVVFLLVIFIWYSR